MTFSTSPLRLALALLAIGFCLVSPMLGFAENAGVPELRLLNMIFNGYIGFALGLMVVTVGIYVMARGNMSGGITLIILGVLITLTPGVFNSARSLFMPMVCALWSLNCSLPD